MRGNEEKLLGKVKTSHINYCRFQKTLIGQVTINGASCGSGGINKKQLPPSMSPG